MSTSAAPNSSSTTRIVYTKVSAPRLLHGTRRTAPCRRTRQPGQGPLHAVQRIACLHALAGDEELAHMFVVAAVAHLRDGNQPPQRAVAFHETQEHEVLDNGRHAADRNSHVWPDDVGAFHREQSGNIAC